MEIIYKIEWKAKVKVVLDIKYKLQCQRAGISVMDGKILGLSINKC